ncbi:MAG: MarR family transcriptional regulator [bacterium]|nr:MarR family transcriptional regulator [bacterium]
MAEKNPSSFSVEAPEESPGLLLWQVTILWQRQIKSALDPHSISHSQFVLMAVLLWIQEQGEKSRQAALIEYSKLDKMTVSQGLKALSKKGLITRFENPEDTRSKLVKLTQRGSKLAEELVLLVEHTDRKFFAALNMDQEKSLKQSLHHLSQKHSA